MKKGFIVMILVFMQLIPSSRDLLCKKSCISHFYLAEPNVTCTLNEPPRSKIIKEITIMDTSSDRFDTPKRLLSFIGNKYVLKERTIACKVDPFNSMSIIGLTLTFQYDNGDDLVILICNRSQLLVDSMDFERINKLALSYTNINYGKNVHFKLFEKYYKSMGIISQFEYCAFLVPKPLTVPNAK